MPLDPTQRYITSLTSNQDTLFVGLADYRVELFNLLDYSHKRTISDDLWEVKSVYVDEQYLLVSSLNEAVGVYDLRNMNKISVLNHPLGVLKMWSDEDYIYTTSYNKEVWLWDRNNFELKHKLMDHSVRTNCVVSSQKYIYTGDGFTIPNAAIRIFDKNSKDLVSKLDNPKCKRVNEIRLIDNQLFSAHGSPGIIEIKDINTFNTISTLKTGSDCTSLVIDKKYIAAAVKDMVFLWDREFKLVAKINEDEREVTSVVLHDGNLIYGSRNTLKVYNITNNSVIVEKEL